MPRKIQLRRDTAANFIAANPILLRGEPAFETDTKSLKVGDGVTAYNSLPASYLSESEVAALIADHADRTDNPHSVTKSQIGLGSVDNTSDMDKPISTATQAALDDKADASSVYTKTESDSAFEPKNANIQSHIASISNPHSVSKSQIGLGDVDNVSAASLRDRSTHTGTDLDPEVRGQILWAKNETDALVDLTELIAFASTMGLTHGGRLTVSSGRIVNVDEMSGYTMIDVVYATHRLVQIEKEATTIEVPANGSYYVYYTASGVLSTSVSLPSNRTNIILGRVVTDADNVLYIEKSELDAHHWSNYVDRMLREAMGPIFASGGLVSQNVTPLKLDVSSGIYFYGEHRLTLSSATAATWDAYYRDGASGFTRIASQDTIPVTQYDSGTGTLTSIPSGKFVKFLLLAIKEQTGTQKFLLVYPQAYYDTQGQAEATPLQTTPSFAINSFVKIASIVVQQGASSIAVIIDERPRLGTVSSSVAGAVSLHGDLTGLDDDDHEQYLLANGGRPLEGNLNFNGNSITDIGTVNDVVIQAHGSRHAGDGADPVPSATTSVAGLMSASDKSKLDSVASGATANESDAYLLDRAHHTGTQLASTISDFTSAVQAVTIDAAKIDGGVVSNAEFATLDGITTGVSIQSQIDGKQETITGAASTITNANLTASRALSSDGSGKVAVSATTSTELGYVAGVTSAIQTQFSGKANLAGGNTFTGKQVMSPSATDPGLNLGSIASDPSAPANGDVWYNSTSGDIKVRKAGTTQLVRSLIAQQVITAGTTYTPTAGATFIDAILVGAGGGGGGVTGTATNVGVGSGGGAGAILRIATALTGAASYTIAIGTAGPGGTAGANAGTAGTATTLTIGATTYSAGGGTGGGSQLAGTTVAGVLGGAGGTASNGSLNVTGAQGDSSYRFSGTTGFPGKGASGPYGGGGPSAVSAGAGNPAVGYGAGGSGGFSTANVNRAGGNGTPGLIIINEYA